MVPIPTSHYLDQSDRGHHSYANQHWAYTTPNTDWYSGNPQSQNAAWEQAYSSGCTAPKDTFLPRQYSSASDSSAAEDPPQDWLPQIQSNGEPRRQGALHRVGENWGSSSPPRGYCTHRPTSSSPSGAEGARSPARAHAPAEPGPAASARPTRYWPSSPREQEGDRTESLCSVEEERDDSFTAVLDFIRRSHDLEKPVGVAPFTRQDGC